MSLIIILMFVIGMTIGSYIYNSKIANAITTINAGSLTTGTILGNPTIIGIQLSNTCIKMVQENQTNDCPSYYKLKGLDTTNQMMSGKFVFTNGYYHRLAPQTKNHYQMYKTDQTIIMLDPDYMSTYLGKTILIVPQGFSYHSNLDNATNGTRTEYLEYVSPDCKQATISYNATILNNTISYLKSGCTTKSFVEKKVIPLPAPHKLDYNTAISKYKAWLEQAKKQHSENCIIKKCKTVKNIYSNW